MIILLHSAVNLSNISEHLTTEWVMSHHPASMATPALTIYVWSCGCYPGQAAQLVPHHGGAPVDISADVSPGVESLNLFKVMEIPRGVKRRMKEMKINEGYFLSG